MQRPYIGITTSYQDGIQKIDHTYIQAVEKADGIPVIVPMLEQQESALAFARLLDGLIITGGPGIIRGLVGELPEDLPCVDAVRNTSDTLIYQAVDQQPILGICYGMQFINSMHNGTIYADVVAQIDGAHAHSPQRGAEPHAIELVSGSRLAQLFKQSSLEVNTYHIQAIAKLGTGLIENAYSDDGIIEGFESTDGRLLGLQFHPERMESMAPIFADFVARCAQNASSD